jgi:mannose-6-phosphate isomerase-like protein (cupin superfamily)
MLEVARFDPNNLKKYEAYDGNFTTWVDLKFDSPACIAAFEEARPGDNLSAPWHFWNDEVLYVVEGRMKLEWSSPPMFNDHSEQIVSAGDLILAKAGLSLKLQALDDKTARFIWVAMPRPRYFGDEAFWGQTQAE